MGTGISETRRPAGLEAVMASLSSDDRSEKSANGTIKRLHDNSTRAPGRFGDEQTLADSDQTLADSDQSSAERDQTRRARDHRRGDRHARRRAA